MQKGGFRKGEIVFAECIGEEPWPARIAKVMELAAFGGLLYKVEFINHKSTSTVEAERLMPYTEQNVLEQTRRQKKRGAAGKSVLNAIKAADKVVKQANLINSNEQRKTQPSKTDIRQSQSIIKHVLEMQNEDEEWNPCRKDPQQQMNQSFILEEEKRNSTDAIKYMFVEQPQMAEPQLDLPLPNYSHQIIRYSPTSSLLCNLSKTVQDLSNSQFHLEESQLLQEEEQHHRSLSLDHRKEDLDFSCEQAKLSYILTYLSTSIDVYKQMPQPTQIQQFSALLNLISHRLINRNNTPLTLNEKFEFNTFIRLISGLESKPEILARMVNCVLAYEMHQPHGNSSYSLEYIVMREKLECLCLMRPFICFPIEAQRILIKYIRKSEVAL